MPLTRSSNCCVPLLRLTQHSSSHSLQTAQLHIQNKIRNPKLHVTFPWPLADAHWLNWLSKQSRHPTEKKNICGKHGFELIPNKPREIKVWPQEEVSWLIQQQGRTRVLTPDFKESGFYFMSAWEESQKDAKCKIRHRGQSLSPRWQWGRQIHWRGDTMPPVLEILFQALALSPLSAMTASLFSLAALSSVI